MRLLVCPFDRLFFVRLVGCRCGCLSVRLLSVCLFVRFAGLIVWLFVRLLICVWWRVCLLVCVCVCVCLICVSVCLFAWLVGWLFMVGVYMCWFGCWFAGAFIDSLVGLFRVCVVLLLG